MKRFGALMAAAACAVISANAAAYGIYCENAVAGSAMAEYRESLLAAAEPQENAGEESSENEISTDGALALIEQYSAFAEELTEQEYSLAENLIDYDVLLQKLQITHAQYKRLKAQYDELTQSYLVGECTKQQFEAAEKSKDDKYNDIKALLFEISALKQEIESVTGETLKADFDYSQCYLIIDALKLSLDEISDYGAPCAIVRDESFEYKKPDLSKSYTEAVKLYYALGDALRLYVNAAQEYESAQSDFKLGSVSGAKLDELFVAYENARVDALESKADYAKALLGLDKESGGALTANVGLSGGLYSALDSALPKDLKGSGLWKVRANGDTTFFSVSALPISFDPEKDSGGYELRLNGKTLFKAVIGQEGVFDGSVSAGESVLAEVLFRVNGKETRFLVDIYSPFGEFLEG